MRFDVLLQMLVRENRNGRSNGHRRRSDEQQMYSTRDSTQRTPSYVLLVALHSLVTGTPTHSLSGRRCFELDGFDVEDSPPRPSRKVNTTGRCVLYGTSVRALLTNVPVTGVDGGQKQWEDARSRTRVPELVCLCVLPCPRPMVTWYPNFRFG